MNHAQKLCWVLRTCRGEAKKGGKEVSGKAVFKGGMESCCCNVFLHNGVGLTSLGFICNQSSN